MAETRTFSFPNVSIGGIIAIIVLIVALVLVIIGKMDPLEGGLFAALAVARLT